MMTAPMLIFTMAVDCFDVRLTQQEALKLGKQIVFYNLLLGILTLIGTFGSRALLRLNAHRQGYNIRKAYLTALINREISFFDMINPAELSSQVENDCKTVV